MRGGCPHPDGTVPSEAIGRTGSPVTAHDRDVPIPQPVALTAVLLAAVGGWLLGAVTRRWLAYLDRGGRVLPTWCEAGVGSLWAAAVAGWSAGAVPGPVVPLLLVLAWLVVAGSAVDLAVRRLPDALTLPACGLVLASLVPLGGPAVLRGAAGALVLCAAHAAVRWCAPSAMGGGDVKLAASVGAAAGGLSWAAAVAATVLAAALTALACAAVRRHALPHGPSMLVGCLTVVAGAATWPGAVGVG